MSRSIDERIVEMQFNNQDFEKNAQQSLSTLDKLKQSLNLLGTGDALKGIGDVDTSGIDHLQGAVGTVSEKFSALKTIAVGAMLEIGSKIADTTMKLLDQVNPLNQITAGWNKFEEKTQAVQTIMSATRSTWEKSAENVGFEGTQMEFVNSQMEKLNWFTDETSYNFLDMANNIGKFTNNGIGLEDAVTSMTGIANWAAVSGANVQQASHAMYNLSQAMGVGYLGLQDFKSIENSMMATMEFKEAAIQAGIAAGTLEQGLDGVYVAGTKTEVTAENLRETLKKKWLTSDVLTSTLKMYGDFTEELYRTHEDLGDSFMLSKDIINAVDSYKEGSLDLRKIAEENGTTVEAVKEHFDKLSASENELGRRAFEAGQETKKLSEVFYYLQDAASSLWMRIFESIFGNYEEAKELWTALTDEMYELLIVPLENLASVFDEWNEFGGNALLIEGIQNLWGVLKTLVAPIKEAFVEIFPPITGERLADITKAFKDFTAGIKIGEGTLANIKNTFKGFFAILDIGKQVVSAIFSVFGQLIGKIFGVGDAILPVTGNIGVMLVKFDEWLKKNDVIKNALQSFVDFIGGIFDKIDQIFQRLTGSTIGETLTAFRNKLMMLFADIAGAIANLGNGEATSGLSSFVDSFKRFFEPLGNLLDGFRSIMSALWAGLKNLGPLFASLARGVGDALKAIGDGLKNAITGADSSKLIDLANGGVLLGIAGMLKKFISGFKSKGDSGGGIIAKIKEIKEALLDFSESLQKSIQVNILLKIAAAIAIMSVSLLMLASIDSNKLAGALATMTAEFAELVGFMTVLDKKLGKDGGSRINKVALGMIAMSLGVLILSSAMKKLAGLSWDDILKGLVAVGVLCAELTRVAKNLSKDAGTMMKGATGLIAFAIAIRLLVKPVRELGSLDIPTLVKGLTSLGVLFAELGVFMKLADFSGFGVGTGLGMIELAAAILIMGKAIAQIGSLDIPTLAKGLIAMGIGLAEITVAMKFMPTTAPIIATGMLLMGAALLVIGQALKSMGNMSWEQMAKGLITMGVALAEIAVAMHFMTGALPGAAALLVVAGALAILTPVLHSLGSMSLGEIIKSLVMLAGTFAIFGGAAALLTPVIPSMYALAGAITLLGVGAMAAGAGIALLGLGLASLAGTGAAALELLKAAVTILLTMIPDIAASVGRAILGVIEVIGNGAPIITGAIKNIILSVLDMVVSIKDDLITTVVEVVTNILAAIADNAPSILDSVIRIVIALLTAVRDNIGPMIDIVVDTLLAILAGITAKIPDFIQAGIDIIIGLIDGLAKGIEDNTPRIKQAVINLFKALINAAKEILGIHSPSTVFSDIGMNMILGAIEGIKSMLSDIKTAISDIINSAIDKAKEFISKFVDVGGDLIGGLAEGIKGGLSKAVEAVRGLANGVVNTAKNLFQINSPSKIFAWMGEMNDEGLAQGFLRNSWVVEEAAGASARSAIDAMAQALTDANSLVTDAIDINPTISPVLDLSNVEDGVDQMNGMFGNGLTTSAAGLPRAISPNNQILSALNGMSAGGNTANFNIYVTGGQNANAQEVAEEVMRRINIEYQRQKAVWA